MESESERQLSSLIIDVNNLKRKLSERNCSKRRSDTVHSQLAMSDFLTKNSQRKFRGELSFIRKEMAALNELNLNNKLANLRNCFELVTNNSCRISDTPDIFDDDAKSTFQDILTDTRKRFTGACISLSTLEQANKIELNHLNAAKTALIGQLKAQFFVLTPDLEDSLRLYIDSELKHCSLQNERESHHALECKLNSERPAWSTKEKSLRSVHNHVTDQSLNFYCNQAELASSFKQLESKACTVAGLMNETAKTIDSVKVSSCDLLSLAKSLSNSAAAPKLSGPDFCILVSKIPSWQLGKLWKNEYSRKLIFAFDSIVAEQMIDSKNGSESRDLEMRYSREFQADVAKKIREISRFKDDFSTKQREFVKFCRQLDREKMSELKAMLKTIGDEYLHAKRLSFVLSH